jgi:hypothetical protein
MNESEFLRYVLRPLTDEELTLLYKANNICYERCGLYSDFLQSIMDLIKETYLGDDVVISADDRESHFKWCLNKIIINFKDESINFTRTPEIYDLLHTYAFDFFYNEKDKDNMTDKMVKYWEHIFKYSAIKTKSELDTMVDVYRIFEKSLFMSEKIED